MINMLINMLMCSKMSALGSKQHDQMSALGSLGVSRKFKSPRGCARNAYPTNERLGFKLLGFMSAFMSAFETCRTIGTRFVFNKKCRVPLFECFAFCTWRNLWMPQTY